MINTKQPLWWTLTKMILSLPGSILSLWLAIAATYWMTSDLLEGIDYVWYSYLIVLALYLFGAYLMMVFIIGIITLVRQNKEA